MIYIMYLFAGLLAAVRAEAAQEDPEAAVRAWAANRVQVQLALRQWR